MYQLVTVIIVVAAIILIFVVMIQNSKGGGLAAGFSSSNQVMGVRKTTDFLEKATWSLACTIVFLCIIASLFKTRSTAPDSSLRDEIQNFVPVDQSAFPDFGTPVQEEGGSEPVFPIQ